MITKNNWLNAGILLTIIADIILLNIYVIQKIEAPFSGFKFIEYDTIKVWLIILGIVLVILAVGKLIVFLIDKEGK